MDFVSPTVKSRWIDVTPELAQSMLKTSIGNRKLRQSHIDVLANSMRRGEWRLTHQGIAFDINGNLKDGHHRLTAVSISGITVKMMLTIGVDPQHFDAVDQGIIRTLSDVSGIPKRVLEPVRLGAAIFLATYGKKLTMPQILEVSKGGLLDYSKLLFEYAPTSAKYYSSAPMKLAAVVSMLKSENSQEINYVLDQYKSLVNAKLDELSCISKCLVSQVMKGGASANKDSDTIARGLKVFDKSKAMHKKLIISVDEIDDSLNMVRNTIGKSINKPMDEFLF